MKIGELVASGAGTCCSAPAALPVARVDASFVKALGGDEAQVDFLVPEMHCAACLTRIEDSLGALPGVRRARANLTTHRVSVAYEAQGDPDGFLSAIEKLGYSARPFDAAALDAAGRDAVGSELLRALAVAGFAASNIMLLSVSVWSGADAATRDLFHWLSALIALPAIAYAGRPFFRSAFRAVAGGGLNMDVPIVIGVTLTAAMSLYETATGGHHAYFDASISLLFFLLVGRYLDHRMRDVARSAAARLLSLSARSATRIEADGTFAYVPIGEVAPGDRVTVAAGERIPVDGLVGEGSSDVDRSMLTGESDPERVGVGAKVFAGTLNLTGPLTVTAEARAGDTLLAEIVRLMESAERAASRYVRIADRASRLYAPLVHLLALLTVFGWLILGGGWHLALTAAVAVLIITCPCALGLAVPAVQVVASGFLLKRGVMLKDGSALERLAKAEVVVFDKTGTLTEGEPRLVEASAGMDTEWAAAIGLGQASRHPLARALAKEGLARGFVAAPAVAVEEQPGEGMRGEIGGIEVRLGRLGWTGGGVAAGRSGNSEIWLRVGAAAPIRFAFQDSLRPDAAETVATLKAAGLDVVLLSGDRAESVAAVAAQVGIADWRAAHRPEDKVAFLSALAASGKRVLMVGDGLNDAPALATAFVSMSPASAADISQTAADIIFTGKRLAPVATALAVAGSARRLILQNFALAVGYNLLAVPIAMLGYATPLIAAVAMSTSSILVTANALRLPLMAEGRRMTASTASRHSTPAEVAA
ncbi:heavy metal translocating P-type ATPase metal-binding domain-containing protein [soil metagenome]